MIFPCAYLQDSYTFSSYSFLGMALHGKELLLFAQFKRAIGSLQMLGCKPSLFQHQTDCVAVAQLAVVYRLDGSPPSITERQRKIDMVMDLYCRGKGKRNHSFSRLIVLKTQENFKIPRFRNIGYQYQHQHHENRRAYDVCVQ